MLLVLTFQSFDKPLPVFSLNFISAGKGPFMVGKAKNMPQGYTFLGEGDGEGEGG